MALPATPAMETGSAPSGAPSAVPAGEPDATTHVVKRGENLTTIARHANTTVFELLKLNKIEDERKLQIGQVLLLPKPGASPAAPQPKTDSQ